MTRITPLASALGAGCVLLLVAYLAVSEHVAAVEKCVELDGGGRAYFTLLVLPALTLTLWLAAGIPIVGFARRRLKLSLTIAALLVGLAIMWFAAGIPGYIRSLTDSYPEVAISCPGGLPPGWPVWLDR